MQGASPLASPRLNPGGTGAGGESRTRQGACLLCRLPPLSLVFFSAPIPPAPLPLRGRGEPQRLFRRGLRPRHPCIRPFAALTELSKQVPGGLNPGGTGAGGESRTRRGACLLCRLPTLPLACFLSPIPPYPPSPAGKGETLGYFYARGFAPCIPAPKPRRHRSRGRITHPAGGLLSLSPACPSFSLLPCPLSPRPPSPAGKGGSPKDYFAGGFAPGTPALNRLRHLQTVPNRYPEG